MTEEQFSPMTDEQRFGLVCELFKTLSPEFKDAVLKELLAENSTGETQLQVSSNDQVVKLDFGKPLAWFAIPKAHALQLGVLLMQHAGATLEQIQKPESRPDGKSDA